MACFRAGVIACPVNPLLPVAGLTEVLSSVNCRGVLGIEEASEAATALGARMLRLGDVLSDRCTADVQREHISFDQPASIVFTSGSSGRPKGALLSYGNLYHSAASANDIIEVGPGDRWLLSLPLYHVAGLGILFRCLFAGGTVVTALHEADLLETISACEITHLSLVSTQLSRLLDADASGRGLLGLKAVLVGGGPIPERLVRRAEARGLPLHTTYGLTETASLVTVTRKGDGLHEWLTSGKPLRPDTVRIRDDGEILVRGNTLFAGYVQGETVQRPQTDGDWFAPGDLGRFDELGNLHVVGRKDNMFVSGGENIQPEEIERHLCSVPGVEQALVVSVEDAEFGAVPVAFVEMESGAVPDNESLVRALGEYLPRFKVPRASYAWPSQLKAEGIKPNRKALAARAAAYARAEQSEW
jgi:O-succinylbenzoic acid--CoA ligase